MYASSTRNTGTMVAEEQQNEGMGDGGWDDDDDERHCSI